MSFGKEDHGGPVPVDLDSHIVSTSLITAAVGFNHLAEVVSVRYLHFKVTLFPLAILCSLEGSHYAQHT